MQERDDFLEIIDCCIARAALLATVVAVASGCASREPVLTTRGGDAPAAGAYAGLGFADLPLASLQHRKTNLRPESSRRGLIGHVLRAPAGRLAADLLADAADWCAGNAGELVNGSENQELTNQIIDILGAEYKLERPQNVRSQVCRTLGGSQTVVSAEGPEVNLPLYVVWTTDAEINAARATISSDRAKPRDSEDIRKTKESKRRSEAAADKQKRPSTTEEQIARPDQPNPATGNGRKLKALDAEFAKLDQHLYRSQKAAGAASPARNAATAASKAIADALGPLPGSLSAADVEQGLGRTNVARLGYFASGACTLRAFRPYQQSAVDLRKVNWDDAKRSIHAVKAHIDATGTSIPSEGATVVRLNLLSTAMDVDSIEDAARMLKAAQLIASACMQAD